jgi:hypothetical protein
MPDFCIHYLFPCQVPRCGPFEQRERLLYHDKRRHWSGALAVMPKNLECYVYTKTVYVLLYHTLFRVYTSTNVLVSTTGHTGKRLLATEALNLMPERPSRFLMLCFGRADASLLSGSSAP